MGAPVTPPPVETPPVGAEAKAPEPDAETPEPIEELVAEVVPGPEAPAAPEPEIVADSPVQADTAPEAVEDAPVIEAQSELEPTQVLEAPPAEPADTEPAEPVKPVRRARRRAAPALTFQAPDPIVVAPVRSSRRDAALVDEPDELQPLAVVEGVLSDPELVEGDELDTAEAVEGAESDDDDDAPRRRRRRGRRGRGRVRDDEGGDDGETSEGEPAANEVVAETEESAEAETPEAEAGEGDGEASGSSRRRRTRQRRSRKSGDDDDSTTEPRTRDRSDRDKGEKADRSPALSSDDEIRGVSGSTRLEAKRQRRRESRDTSRRRVPVVTEAEFLARRESVNRVMVVRNAGERTQIAVLEDNVLVEHYVTRASSSSYAGNVYVGRVQNVLPSMEAAFVDIGKGRNGVLYAGEVNYDASGLEGKPRKIEQVLKPGQAVLVQVTKDPIGHKGARLTSQISLPGRYMVYVPEGGSAGISRKLPDSERSRLRSILKKVTPEDAGVIVRTAAEGASEDELQRDIARLAAQWADIQKKSSKVSPPGLLYAEPDLVIRVIRDIFNEDFHELVVQGDSEWEMIESYVSGVAPDLLPRLRRDVSGDAFAEHRIDEQLLKALDRKVYLPSGGSLVFDRTEAMTVVDVNTGRFTGKGGNLEETVTKNNLEAAEELVRQLRLRDVGGIVVVDFIDMVLESNRELVLRRLTECLGRDRTKHQVAEVTSLGLVQMTRKRVGQGLLEAYSEPCPTCGGRGHTIELPGPGGPKIKPKPMPRPPAARDFAGLDDLAEEPAGEPSGEVEVTADEVAEVEAPSEVEAPTNGQHADPAPEPAADPVEEVISGSTPIDLPVTDPVEHAVDDSPAPDPQDAPESVEGQPVEALSD